MSFLIFFVNNSSLLAQNLPDKGSAKHLGVKTCGNASCHAASMPWQNSSVLQNEFITWSNFSSHSQAYKTLTNAKSQRIATNLSIGNPTESKLCLSCHADNVSIDLRGTFFDIKDGVGCESCHGGAENWLGQHISATGDHKDNVALGMFPTDDPFARAKLCSSCHVGNKDKLIIHKIYGAGHPRLVFELDTYLVNQPAHYRIDTDYKHRKRDRDGVKDWAIGQVLAASFMLDRLSDTNRSMDGMFPELSLFDCHACHRSINDTEPKSLMHQPGVPRLNDSGLIMVGIIAEAIAPEISRIISDGPNKLHAASSKSFLETAEVANELLIKLKLLYKKLDNLEFSPKIREKLVLLLLEKAVSGVYEDFSDAEQATLAITSLLDASKGKHIIKGNLFSVLNNNLNEFYVIAENGSNFSPSAFKEVAKKVLDSVD